MRLSSVVSNPGKLVLTALLAACSTNNSSEDRPVSSCDDSSAHVSTYANHQQITPDLSIPVARPQPTLSFSPVVYPKSTGAPKSHLKDPVDMKLLVISADGKESELATVKSTLDAIGIPYRILIAAETPLSESLLWDGTSHGFYQGIVLTTGNLALRNPETQQWESAFNPEEWATLWNYEAMFGIRQVTTYAMPDDPPNDYGLKLVESTDTSTTPLAVQLTTQGQLVFSYLKPSTTILIEHAWSYLATIVSAADTIPLILTADGKYAIASIHSYPDGRQNLTFTVSSNPSLTHSMLVSYGFLNWVSKGIFLGERHVNVAIQIDDMLIADRIWDPTASPPSDSTGKIFRMTSDDYQRLIEWQNQTRVTFPGLTLEMAFNGKGASGLYSPDTLTPDVIANNSDFNWVSHTYEHGNLDGVSYQTAQSSIDLNNQVARSPLVLQHYDKTAMVQPAVSGLCNLEFLRAAADLGIQYLVSDSSRPSWDSPTPNTGITNAMEPRIFAVPRRPVNLFYNVSTPEEWTSEYNAVYGVGGTSPLLDHVLSYEEILEREATLWLRRLLKFELNPSMFHQSNLRAYNNEAHSLLGDLLDKTLGKYSQFYALPLRNLTQRQVGERMQQRMIYNASQVTAVLIPPEAGSSGRCSRITLLSPNATVVPMTGVASGSSGENYGGQPISYVSLEANKPLTLEASACQ